MDNIEITVIISIISVAFAIYFGLKSAKRDDSKDIKERAQADAIVNVKLDNIATTVNYIKNDITDTKKQVIEIDKKLAIVEQSVKSAHHRIDEHLKGRGEESNA